LFFFPNLLRNLHWYMHLTYLPMSVYYHPTL
jgi:hypothetical protein